MKPLSDERLAQEALRGDDEAFDVLVRRYYPRVLGLCRKMLRSREAAHDAAQEAMLRAYRKLHLYDPSRRFSAWLIAITVRVCVSQAERERRQAEPREELGKADSGLQDYSQGPAEAVQRAQVAYRVAEAVRSLPNLYKPVCVLRHLEGMSYQEIAELTGLPVGTVKVHLFRAKRYLREQLADLVGEE